MKKILVFLLLMILHMNNVYASPDYSAYNKDKDENDILFYDIEKFEITNDKININGWAFLDKVNTIAGENYDVSIVVLKEDDLISNTYASYYSHSYDLHRKSKNGFDRKIIEDLSFEEIDKDFKKKVADSSYFAFPYGRSVEGIENILKDNRVKLAFSYNQFRHMNRDDNIYYLPRYMIVDMLPDVYFRWVLG